jgi:hypothetical protein
MTGVFEQCDEAGPWLLCSGCMQAGAHAALLQVNSSCCVCAAVATVHVGIADAPAPHTDVVAVAGLTAKQQA